MTEPFDYLDMSILGSSTKYDRVTLHRRPIFGGRQKYRKVFHAWCETRKDKTDTYKLKSKSDSKGQATDEARLLFKDYQVWWRFQVIC